MLRLKTENFGKLLEKNGQNVFVLKRVNISRPETAIFRKAYLQS